MALASALAARLIRRAVRAFVGGNDLRHSSGAQYKATLVPGKCAYSSIYDPAVSPALASWFVCRFCDRDGGVPMGLVQRHDKAGTFVGNGHRIAGCHPVVGERRRHLVGVTDLKFGQVDPVNVASRHGDDAYARARANAQPPALRGAWKEKR